MSENTDNNNSGTPADAILDAATRANLHLVRLQAKVNANYKSEYKKYVTWVLEHPELHIFDVPFVRREAVDHYFARKIVERNVCRNTVTRVVNALQWFADNSERVYRIELLGENNAQLKLAESEAVHSARQAQQICHVQSGGRANPGSDPHNRLKDIIPIQDLKKIMSHIYRHRNDWGAASVNFTWGQNGAVRGASNRKLKYCDLNVSNGFGPETDGEQSNALLLIMRKGEVHKDRHEKDQQVACWRHKHYVLCSVFCTALYLVYELSKDDNEINFFHNDRSSRAPWWDIPFIDWEAYAGT